MSELDEPHVCFGCQRQIGSGEKHIHVGLDEWATMNDLAPLGMDDLLTFPFCSQCTEKTERGWQEHQHAVAEQK